MSIGKKAAAEFLGTFWLVLGGVGTAVLAGSGVGTLGISLAFGLTVVTMAYAIGHVSGCHLNPAVSAGLVAGGRMKASELPAYVIAQVLGAIAAAAVLMIIVKGGPAGAWESVKASGFASNGYADSSPGGFGLVSVFIAEALLTMFFLIVIMGATDGRAPAGFGGLAIGLCLVLIHLISIPVSNTSVNPARSTGPALFAGAEAISQLWVFWVAPIVGGIAGGIVYNVFAKKD